jgi:Na+-driven multidrug efflux pump
MRNAIKPCFYLSCLFLIQSWQPSCSFSTRTLLFSPRRTIAIRTTCSSTRAGTTSSLYSHSAANEYRVTSNNKRRFSRLRGPPLLLSKNNEDDHSSAETNATVIESSASSTESSSLSLSPSSSSSSQEDSSELSNTVPSYRKLSVFTATTILIWISEPLLSLVDTTIVGMTTKSAKSAVVQIAALGPATTLYDSAIYMTYFLAIAATNQLAPALAKNDWRRLRESTSHFMGLALLFGCLVTAITFGFGRSFITSMVGPLTESQIIPLATNYACIRAAVAPFCVVDFVAQSFCLATLDMRTPALAVVVASIVNIIGDLALSPRWGIQGAAVATAMATVSSCLILVAKVRRKTREWKQKQEAEEEEEVLLTTMVKGPKTQVVDGAIELLPPNDSIIQNQKYDDTTTVKESTTDAVNGEAIETTKTSPTRDIPFFSLPDKSAMVDLFKLAGPIFFVMMGKIACYSIMTVKATNFGIVPLAAHNIMMRVFFFFSCFGDSVSQAAQTFFPQVAKKGRGVLEKRLFYLSSILGLFVSQFSALILRQFGGYLTKDAEIIKLMADYSSYVGAAVLLHPFIMVLEGTILAKRDLLFLVGMYVSTMALHFRFVFSPISATL